MKRVFVVGIILAIVVNVSVLLIGFGTLQNQINQLKLEKSELENLTQHNPAETTTQPKEPQTEAPIEELPEQTSATEDSSSATSPEYVEGSDFLAKPSVPEFSWNFVDYSYDVPPVYEADQFTGESVIVERGYRFDNRSIEVIIKNQPLNPFEGADGNFTSLYFGVRLKGHYTENWTYAPIPRYYGYHRATDSEYTIISLRLASYGLKDITNGGQIDLQVEALIGSDERIPTWTMFGESCYYEFTGETSGWSQTLTITYPNNPEPTVNSTVEGNTQVICDSCSLSFVTDGGLWLAVRGNVINRGTKTAYNVQLHIETWFSDGTKGMDEVVTLNKELIWILPFKPVNIAEGESYSLTSRWFPGRLVVSVPGTFWLDKSGIEYPYDLITTYKITPIWSDTQ